MAKRAPEFYGTVQRACRDWLLVSTPGFLPGETKQEKLKRRETLDEIINATCYACRIGPRMLLGAGDRRAAKTIRWAAYWVAFQRCGASSACAIGRAFKRNHSSILHALKKVEANMPAFIDTIMAIEDAIIAGHTTRESFDLSHPSWVAKDLTPKAMVVLR